jgi:hypothetical protein
MTFGFVDGGGGGGTGLDTPRSIQSGRVDFIYYFITMNIAVKLLLLITKILTFYLPVFKYTIQLIQRLSTVLVFLCVVAADD